RPLSLPLAAHPRRARRPGVLLAQGDDGLDRRARLLLAALDLRPGAARSGDGPAAGAGPALRQLVVVAGPLGAAVVVVDAGVVRRGAEVAVPAGVAAGARDLGRPGVAVGGRVAERGRRADAEGVDHARRAVAARAAIAVEAAVARGLALVGLAVARCGPALAG